MYKFFIRRFLFLFSSERAHYLAMFFLKIAFRLPFFPFLLRKLYCYEHPSLERNFCGIRFPNPVGLAAGFDKDGRWIDELACLGFGFIEVGTVTPKPQPGNDAPRLFRLIQDNALINRMGFNNQGVDALVERLKKRTSTIIIGGNIGKNKITANEDAISDYAYCFEKLFDYVDYFVVNVSSPNTPGLRALQEKEPLTKLLAHLQALNLQKVAPKPIFLKIAPDLTTSQLDDIIEIVLGVGLAGVIATNTTLDRKNLTVSPDALEKIGNGGLSGLPLATASADIIQYLSTTSQGKLNIIGVGGIHSTEQAKDKMMAGAALIQVYTGFIYEGPALVKSILKDMVIHQ